jgi:hypothetical protein
LDYYLTASARVFRVYKPTPPHYHESSDEYLYVFSGRGTFWMEDESTRVRSWRVALLQAGTMHAQPMILQDPVVFLAIDTPRRDPKDIVLVNPEDGTSESFIRPDQKLLEFGSSASPFARFSPASRRPAYQFTFSLLLSRFWREAACIWSIEAETIF